uniref:tRNA (carboxymethyluridine(34)-5-O)-methyltransferase n=1 Tax=Setaria digitata TaxID=48799 RepID=A0A915Q5E1_9BILA
MNQSKISRKLRKCIQQLQKHDPDVEISSTPTEILFVANSSPLCGISYNDLETIFNQFGESCDFMVFQRQRSYSFVIFNTISTAQLAYQELHGRIPPELNSNALPFYIAFVKNVPAVKRAEPPHKPNDLLILSNFISKDEEEALITVIRDYMPSGKVLKNRKVIHFGFEFNYDDNMASEQPSSNPIPDVCGPIIDRMVDARIFWEKPDQLTINIYEPGNGIPSHVDTHSAFSNTIASLSLLSDIVMEFRDFANTSTVYDVLLPRFSLAVMRGESRYRWKHGIAKRKYDINPATNKLMHRQLRVSFTFRKVIREKCQCAFIEYCDWDRNGAMKVPDSDEFGLTIEEQYVSAVYESIADHFDTTRHAQWNGVAKFLENFQPGTVVYDIGCDLCGNLCRIANQKDCNVLRADILSLPFKSSSAGAVLCIAVIHHLSTKMRRIRAVQELIRILEPGGQACITVWAYEQKLSNEPSEYLKMRQKKRDVQMNRRDSHGRLRVHEGREFTQQDMFVPFQNVDGSRHLRYYHLFRDFELEDLITSVGGCIVEQYFYEQGNWIAYVRKA